MAGNQYISWTDQELLRQYYVTRNNDWLGVLLERYTLMLFGVCMKYFRNEEMAKDAVQQIFLKVISELPRHEVTYFKSWLYIVTKNHCLMALRKKNGFTVPMPEHDAAMPAHHDGTEEMLAREISLERLERAMHRLGAEQSRCINLFYVEKMSYRQISEHTGFSAERVKSHIQNGKRNLKLLMGQMK